MHEMILCAGEALIDMLPRETGDGERAFAPYAGGAVFNTAIALGRLGTKAGFFSGISNDLFGEVLTNTLAASGVDSSLAARSDRPTTLAFVTLTNGQASYAFYDEGTAGRMLSESDLPALPDDIAAVFFGGISLVVEPCAETYRALMQQASDTRLTMIDPNIRPGFIKDEQAYRTRINSMIDMADIVKISDEDLHWIAGPGDLSEHAATLGSDGKLVLVTEGAKGCTAYQSGTSHFVPANKVNVVDTVGAGDTFNAGVLASLEERGKLSKAAIKSLTPEDIDAALTLGAKAAAVTVSRAGANPPTRDELA